MGMGIGGILRGPQEGEDLLSPLRMGAESEERPQVVCSRVEGRFGEFDLDQRKERE